MEDTKNITAFCANDQAETPHELDIDGNGEILLTCACGRFLKFPAGTDAAGLTALLAAHADQNTGQLSVEAMEQQKASLIASLTA